MKNWYLMAILLFSPVTMASEWEGPFEYGKAAGSFAAGYDKNEMPTLIGMTLHEKNLDFFDGRPARVSDPKIAEGRWVVGRVSIEFRGLLYGADGKEHLSTKYVVFNPRLPENYRWIKAMDGEVPENAVAIWGTLDQYICRAKWSRWLYPGTLVPAQDACMIGVAGKEKVVYVYEALVKEKDDVDA